MSLNKTLATWLACIFIFTVALPALILAEPEQDFTEQDRIFKNCQKVTQAEKYEHHILEAIQKENAEPYLSKREKAKNKLKEKQREDS